MIEKIQREHERDEWQADPNFKELKKYYQNMAKETREKRLAKKSLSIRLQEDTIQKIKDQAEQEGLLYQTLIFSVLYQFSTGKLQRKNTFV